MKEEFPYIKPTRRKHDSGFRMFEVGYCTLGKDNRLEAKRVLGETSDHIWVRSFEVLGDKPIQSLNIDLTMDGYIRFFCHDEGSQKGYTLRWQDEDFTFSSAILKLKPKEEV